MIHSLSFGESYPGIVNPLDDTTRMVGESTGVFMYFAKIIPTVYKGRGGALYFMYFAVHCMYFVVY